ncbi:MDR family MFS transporter [Clostridium estertheticum]|uniref:MDR family MFS transporter n=1 Tax=Clostridium estertheticum TaxID=238834 RepID=UPI001C0BA305|nr:MDR family MFS transporter [Clostridium estertheticum]MBU3075822.1 MFS transporter [Clostridium estertheticum]MBU3166061.1 MFS transporter [Clostridium estertheticum]
MGAKKRNIVIALMVAMFLAAIEGTVVTTAMPTIAKDLKGFELMSWVFSMYLLTSAISTPIYGKLSDMYGRKNILSIGIVIFIIGSALCGLSANIYQLIAFRAFQGLGAGAMLTVTFTIVGDNFSIEENAKVQSWLGSAWGIASLIGPFIGGFLIDFLSWRWIFLINLPFGILAVILLQINLKESFEKRKRSIDYPGALLLSISIVALLFGIMAGQKSNNLLAPSVLGLLALTLISLVLFYFIEKRAKEPIVPFDIFTRTTISVNMISFLVCAVMIGIDVYIPLYLQSVLGLSATISGLSLAPMTITWLLSSIVLSKAIPRYGERIVVGTSALIIVLSSLFLPILNISSPLVLVIICTSLMGIGIGGAFTTLAILVQASAEYDMRGAATATNSLIKTLGQTLAVSILGVVFNSHITGYFNALGVKGIKPDDLYSGAALAGGLPMEHIKISLNSALHFVFIILIFIGIACFLLSFTLSNNLKKNKVGTIKVKNSIE